MARSVPLADDDPEVIRVDRIVGAELDKFLSNPENAVDDNAGNCAPAVHWEESPLVHLAAYATRIVSAPVGSADNERMNFRGKVTRTGQRSGTGYVRNQALMLLDASFNSPPKSIVDDLAASMRILRAAETLDDETEAFLDSFNKRVASLREAAQIAADAAAEVGGVAPDHLVEEDVEATSARLGPDGRRTRRQATSCFYTILARERATRLSAAQPDESDSSYDSDEV